MTLVKRTRNFKIHPWVNPDILKPYHMRSCTKRRSYNSLRSFIKKQGDTAEHIKADDIIAIDFETYYDSEYSLKKLSTYNYIYDEQFDPYLVSAYSKDFSFVGPPSKLDWQCIHGKVVVMHNASFDELVMQRLMELGVIPETVKPAQVLCTAEHGSLPWVPQRPQDSGP